MANCRLAEWFLMKTAPKPVIILNNRGKLAMEDGVWEPWFLQRRKTADGFLNAPRKSGLPKNKNPLSWLRGFDDSTCEAKLHHLYYLLTYIASLTALTTFSAFGKLAAIKVGAYGSGTSAHVIRNTGASRWSNAFF